MRLLRLFALILASPVLILARILGIRPAPMVNLPDDHPEMAAAILKARETLPTFRQVLAAPEPGMNDFGLKARFPVPGGGGEHCWVGKLEPAGADFHGELTVQPRNLPGLRLGSPVTVTEAMITDWAYSLNGVFQGHYTTRVLIPHLTARMRRQVLQAYGWVDLSAGPKQNT